MPTTEVVIFAYSEGDCPLMATLDNWPQRVQDKCWIKIERLQQLGHELRRPEADFLEDGIYELRIRDGNVNYRILYFFHNNRAVLVAGLTKESAVPPASVEAARRARLLYASNPKAHTYETESL